MTKKFITFEGGEGAGKSTLIELVAKYLTDNGEDVLITREPGGTPLGEKIRSLLLSKSKEIQISPQAELYLLLASRVEHLYEVIVPALNEGKYILCDRFNDSTIAYQGYGRGLDPEFVESMCLQATSHCQPSITFYLDVDPKVGLERTAKLNKDYAKEGEKDRMESESLSFHHKLRDGYLEIAKKYPDRFFVVDASKTIDAVFQEVLSILKKYS